MLFGFETRFGVISLFMPEEEAVAKAEAGTLVFYISKFNEPDAFTRSFDTVRTAYVLETDENVMCAFCLSTATLFIVKIASQGQLLAVCPKHANQ